MYYYQLYLRQELEKRTQKNPSYSLHSFAKATGLSAGALSEIINGKRCLSLKSAEKIVESLNLSKTTESKVLNSVVQEQKTRKLKRRDPRLKNWSKFRGRFRSVETEKYRLISDWHYAAIMELTFSDQFKSDPGWISKTLGISKVQAKLALDRLIDLGWIEKKGNVFIKCRPRITTKDKKVTNRDLKRKQIQARELAIRAIEEQPLEKRSMTTMTMCIDPSLIPEAKQRIERFTNELCRFLESKKREQVYMVEIGLFNLQKGH